MLQSDAFARQSAYPVDQSTNEWFFVNYDYWIQVNYEAISLVILDCFRSFLTLVLSSCSKSSFSNRSSRQKLHVAFPI